MIYSSVIQLTENGGLKSITAEPDSLYIVSASFEERSIAATQALAPTYQADNAIIYVNEDSLSGPAAGLIKRSSDTLEQALTKRATRFKLIKGSWEDARKQLESLREGIAFIDSSAIQTITIDTTTFNREALLVCLALLRAHFPAARIRAVYVSPASHGKWLSRGYRKVRSVIGFAGVQQPSQKNALIVLSGFEGDRTVKLIEEYEPSQVFLGVGDPPTNPSFLERNISEHTLVLSRTDVRPFKFPANNIADCVAVLRQHLVVLSGSANVVIAPMSTKLSTVAAFIVADQNPELQLAYCLPGEYNYIGYSIGTARVFVEEIMNYAE